MVKLVYIIGILSFILLPACSSQVVSEAVPQVEPTLVVTTLLPSSPARTPAVASPFPDTSQPTEPDALPSEIITPAPAATQPTILLNRPFLYVEGVSEVYYLARINPDGTSTRLTEMPGFSSPAVGGPDLSLSPDEKKIAFSTLDYSLYIVNTDGSGLTRLLGDDLKSLLPLWSPDGTQLAFVGGPSEESHSLYVMQADGSEIRRITPESLSVESAFNEPLWLPDSKHLLFVGNTETEDHSNLYMVQTNDLGLNCLTCADPIPGPQCCTTPFQVTLSPTDPQAVYVWLDWNLYLFDATTGQHRLLTDPPVSGMGLHWSPDGQYLAFRGDNGAGLGTFVAKVDGSGLIKPLILGDINVSSWSPDGQKLALTKAENQGTRYKFYVVNADGSQFTPMFPDSVQITWLDSATWTPDSQQLLYSISLDKNHTNFDFYLVNADGSHLTRLTNTPGYKQFVTWLPN